jgi:hypothetical protein
VKLEFCSVDGCRKKHKSHGFCHTHLNRFEKYGDASITNNWGKAKRFYEEVVLTYVDKDQCLIWLFGRNELGYAMLWCNEKGKMRKVHQMVCEVQNGPRPNRLQAAHNCGRGSSGCVNRHHLRWDTVIGNQADRLLHGTHNRGERCGSHKFTEDQVLEIRALKGSSSQSDIADISRSQVGFIHQRKRWGWL